MNAKKNLMAFILTVSSIALMVICLGLGMVKACAGGDGSEWKEKVAADTLHVVHYTRPDLPQIMTDPAERAVYYVKHYWDGYLTGDTAWVNSGDTEQLYVDFIDALKYVEPETGRKALHTMMVRMEADSTAYRRFCLLGEKYLNEPNSPMRNEDFYIAVLEQMLQSDRLQEWEKIRPADRLKQAHKNRPGMKAADFTYVTVHGDNSRMSRLKAQYTMLFFTIRTVRIAGSLRSYLLKYLLSLRWWKTGHCGCWLSILTKTGKSGRQRQCICRRDGSWAGTKQAISEPGNFTISALRRLSICLTGGNG